MGHSETFLEFLELLKYSKELEKNLIKKDPAACNKLLKFLIIIEENLN
jgi:hypothetical protein